MRSTEYTNVPTSTYAFSTTFSAVPIEPAPDADPLPNEGSTTLTHGKPWNKSEVTALENLIEKYERVPQKIIDNCQELKGRNKDAIRAKINTLKFGTKKEQRLQEKTRRQYWSTAEHNAIQEIWAKAKNANMSSKSIAERLKKISGSSVLRSSRAIRHYIKRNID